MTPRVEARKLLQELRVTTLPVNLEDICRSLGIAVLFSKLTGLDGFFVKHPKTKATVIVVNNSDSVLRQRFSVAHELGHIRMNHGLSRCSMSGQVTRIPVLEANANEFASELLMPKLLLQRHGYLVPEQIANLCRVSLDAAKIRSEELGWT